MSPIGRLLIVILSGLEILLLIRILLSWIAPHLRYMHHKNELLDLLYKVTDPILDKVRILIPMGHGAIDVGPWVIFMGIEFLKKLVIAYL